MISPGLPDAAAEANGMDGRYLDHDDMRTFYLLGGRRSGSGTAITGQHDGAGTGRTLPVVALHGYGGVAGLWHHWLGQGSLRVIAPDLIGHGRTSRPRGSYRLPYYVDWLAAFIETMDLSAVYLVGNSLGGLIAARYAVEHPDRVDRLVLVGAAGLTDPAVPWSTRWLYVPVILRSLLGLTSGQKRRREWLQRAVVADAPAAAEMDRILQRDGPGDADTDHRRALILTGLHLLRREATLYPDLDRIQAPTLLVWGDEDPQFGVEQARKAHERIPRSRLEVIPGCGHVPMVERPHRFQRLTERFLLEDGS